MANIRVSASKKTTVIILLILFLVVGSTGGYLLWRVNQEKTVAPTDSEASVTYPCGGVGQPDCDFYCKDRMGQPGNGGTIICADAGDCVGRVYCEYPYSIRCENCITCTCVPQCDRWGPLCTVPDCPAGYHEIPNDGTLKGRPQDGQRCDSNPQPDKCLVDCKMECASCSNPSWRTRYCQKDEPTNVCGDGKKGGSEACDPPGSVCTAASGKQSTCSSTCTCPEPANICGDGNKAGDEACDPPGSVCTAASGKQSTCSSTCTCPEPPVGNTCDAQGAKWVTQPPSSVEFGKAIPFEYITGDTDGVQNVNIIVKLDGTSVPVTKIPATDNAPNITVKGTLNGSEGVLSPGNHKLEISWNDTKGAGGVPCYAYASFTVGAAPVNTCDAQGAKWVTQPSSRVEFGKPIPFEYITGDTDGVQNVNIIVKLDGTSVPVTKIPATDNAPNITVKGTLNGSEGVLSPGNHKLEISWNDIKGAGGVPCYAYSMITVLPENPEWDIEKKAVQTCVNDWTENPISNLTYTVTITNTNTGSGAGTITSILDTLDPKVDSTKVTNISNGGVISNGKIVWNLTSPLSDFDPGESKSFTYSINVNKESFGIYQNTVVATPDTSSGDSSNLETSVNIEARCNIPGEPVQPETGLFDDSKNIVMLGAVLLFAGLGWSWITDSFGTMKQKISYESKARFEKRVSKR